MTKRDGQLKLGAFIYYNGHHSQSWRNKNANAKDIFGIDYYKKNAQIAERGKFDMIFLADYLYVANVENVPAGMLDPVNVLSAISAVTENVGLTATVSTTYNSPFNVARRQATLDHISSGRAGWNIVTSQHDIEAQNYGREKHPEHGLRYKMAAEFVDVARDLWDSWEDDAIIADKEKGQFTKLGSVKEINYKGQWYSSRGPLNVPRPPQGYPVLIVAGSSEPGIDFAGQTGEVVFTAQQTLHGAKSLYKKVKDAAAAYGRDPESVKIMPGIAPVIGRTKEEALKKYDELNNLISEEDAVRTISYFLNFDLSKYPAHGPLPFDDLPDLVNQTNTMKSRVQLFLDSAREEGNSIVKLGRKMHGARGHFEFIGTPDEFADLVEEWYNEYACDGFNIMPPILPGDLEEFVELVIPVLQERGLFRTEYEGQTLRENLGLVRPEPGHFKVKEKTI